MASHPRASGRGGYITQFQHRPASHQRHLAWTPSRIVNWAESAGSQTARLVASILEARPHPEQGYVLDDWGLALLSAADSRDILEIIDDRTQQHSTIVASQLPKASWRGKCNELACFSLHPRKIITTGEGGVITTNRDHLAERLRRLRNHGMVRQHGTVDFTEPGFNYRLSEIHAAISIAQMRKLEVFITQRRKVARLRQ